MTKLEFTAHQPHQEYNILVSFLKASLLPVTVAILLTTYCYVSMTCNYFLLMQSYNYFYGRVNSELSATQIKVHLYTNLLKISIEGELENEFSVSCRLTKAVYTTIKKIILLLTWWLLKLNVYRLVFVMTHALKQFNNFLHFTLFQVLQLMQRGFMVHVVYKRVCKDYLCRYPIPCVTLPSCWQNTPL